MSSIIKALRGGLWLVFLSVILIGCKNKAINTVGDDTIQENKEASDSINITTNESTEEDMDVNESIADDNNENENVDTVNTSENNSLPSLYKVYEDTFKVGVALSNQDILNVRKASLVLSQFNSITCENEMKPDFTLDREATLKKGQEEYPVVNMTMADTALTFAKANGLQMRGHTLIWHSQTPKWLFTERFSDGPDAAYVSREVALARMENYIKQVMEYVNTNYPGIVYAWDVVNEAIEPADGHEEGIRIKDNYWYQIIGEDYIEKAFTYARKYATTDQKLFYNDYNTYETVKMKHILNLLEKLKEKKLIDGCGMQDHVKLTYPSILDYENALKKYGDLGLEIQITELDIDNNDNTEKGLDKLATRYKNLFRVILKCTKEEKVNITSVTFWGLTDDRSWLNGMSYPNYPLLFDKDLNPKRAFYGVLQDESVKNY